MTKDLEIYLLYDRKYCRANYNKVTPISQADDFCPQVASLLDFSISLKACQHGGTLALFFGIDVPSSSCNPFWNNVPFTLIPGILGFA